MNDYLKLDSYIAVIIVTFRRPIEVRNLINAILRQNINDVKITIIDNSMDENITNNLIIDFFGNTSVQVIKSKENLGYAKGNNYGLSKSIQKWGAPSYVLISNDDIEIYDCNLIKNLIFVSNNIPMAGCIQPKISLRNGFLQGPYDKSNIWIDIIQYLFPPFWFIMRLIRQRRIKSIDKISGCYRVMGAFFIIKYELFIKAGLFDSQTFLGREEEILALKLDKLGFKSYYVPQCEVTHLQLPKSIPSINHFYDSDDYFYQKIVNVNKFIFSIYKLSRFFYYNLLFLLKFLLRKNDHNM